jgi:hypothetical protein
METPVTIGHIGHHPITRMERCRTAIVVIKGEEKDAPLEVTRVGSQFASHLSKVLEIQQIPVGDVHTLLATLTATQSPEVLLVPWNLHEEADSFFDRVKRLLQEPVSEQTVQPETPPLPKGVPNFGPWGGEPINARDHLDRFVRLYPGWSCTYTRFEAFATRTTPYRSITILWNRSSVPSPVAVEQWPTAMSDACFLLAAVLDAELHRELQVSEQARHDGTLYLHYLCNIVRECCRQLG